MQQNGIEYFHSKEFRNGAHGVFAGLNHQKRIVLLNDLAEISRGHISIGMTAKVTKSIFNQKTTPEFRNKWGTEYTFTIQMLVAMAYFYTEHFGISADFNILIEDGHRRAGEAISSLHSTQEAGDKLAIPAKILTIALGGKLENPLLQAADMLAYSEWQNMNNGDLTIYRAMHSPGLVHEPELFDFDDELVDAVVKGAGQWIAERKQWVSVLKQRQKQTRVAVVEFSCESCRVLQVRACSWH